MKKGQKVGRQSVKQANSRSIIECGSKITFWGLNVVATLRTSFDSMVPSAAVAKNTAVADSSDNTSTLANGTGGTAAVGNNTADTSAVAGNTSDDESSACASVAGDTVVNDSACASVVGDTDESDTDARRDRQLRPLEPMHDELAFPFRENPRSNAPGGSCGIYFANWGCIRTSGDAQVRRQLMRRELRKAPAQILIVEEAREEVARLLLEPQGGGDRNEYRMVRGNEPVGLLIAARSSSCNGLRLLKYEVHNDHMYLERKKHRMANSRMLACTVDFRQSIAHIGTSVNVMGVQTHHRTMKMEWSTAFNEFWDRCAAWIRNYNVTFMAGNFNMALTQVGTQLRSRGIQSDCCAWYPWRHASREMRHFVSFDSSGIFYIGGQVETKLVWGIDRMPELTAVAANMMQSELHVWDEHQITPGQHHEKNLEQMLLDLLQPSTSFEELHAIPRIPGSQIGPYLRITQKDMSSHIGAHFPSYVPLCIYTNTSGARSRQRRRQRAARKGGKGFHKGKGKGDKGKGKGKGKSAVAAPYAGKGSRTLDALALEGTGKGGN